MRLVERYIRRPHLVLSLVLLLSVVGVMGYTKMPFNLFPDVDRPQISVVTVMPGAAAGDVEADITRLIEKELSTIDMVRKVTSTSKDEAPWSRPSSNTKRGWTPPPPTWPMP